jgi:hypothetical protein
MECALLGQGLRSGGHEAGDMPPLACWQPRSAAMLSIAHTLARGAH